MKLCGALLHILQGGKVLFAGADLDHAGHVVDKDLAIADVAGVQGLLGGIHHSVHADLGNDDLDLDLGQQGAVHRYAAVFLGGAFLDAAAHHLGHGHAGHTQIVQRGLELIELGELCNDGHFVHTGVVDAIVDDGRLLDHRHGSVHLHGACLGGIILAQIGVLVGHHGSGVGIGDGETGVSGSQAVLVDIQAVDLHLSGDAQADGFVDDLEDEEHHDHNVHINGDKAQQLGAQLCKAAAVEQALAHAVAAVGEQAHGNGAPHAVCKVNGDSAHGVIDLCNLIKEFNAQDHEDTGHEADDEGTEGRDRITACGDGDQTSQRAVQGHGDIGLAVAQPGEDHGHAGGNGSGQVGVEADKARQGHGLVGGKAQGRAAVEAEPAEPQDEHAQRTGGQIVAGNGVGVAVLIVLADAGAEHCGTQQGNHTAHIVNGCGTGKIMEAHALQPAAAPHPVAADGVDHQRDGSGINAVSLEVCALGHGAGHDGGCRGTEHSLEHDVHPQRDIKPQVAVIALNERIEPADQRACAAEHQAEADDPVARCADAEVHHVFHQDVAGVFGAGKARLTQRKTGLHKVDQECRNQHPTGVYGTEHYNTSPVCNALPAPNVRGSLVQEALYSS